MPDGTERIVDKQYVTTIQYRSDHDNWKDLRLQSSPTQRYNYGALRGNGAVGEKSIQCQPCATHLKVGKSLEPRSSICDCCVHVSGVSLARN
jgi:hypothetical protein